MKSAWNSLPDDMELMIVSENTSPCMMLSTMPEAMMTGRKKIPRITVRPINFWLRMMAMNSENNTISGT